MKGLIIKDILNLKNYMKQLILVLIFFIAYGIFLKNGTFVGTMITLMLSMQVITTMSYDEYAKWDKYALTMNINRKDIVLSKYVFYNVNHYRYGSRSYKFYDYKSNFTIRYKYE